MPWAYRVQAHRTWLLTLALLAHDDALAQSAEPADPSVIRASPVLQIGQNAGDPPHLLESVEDAMRLSDGTIVVLLFRRGLFELRYFDEGGAHINTVGRWGEGPFEVDTGVAPLERLSGDSIIVMTRDLRYSVFGPRGERGRSGRVNSVEAVRPWHPIGSLGRRYSAFVRLTTARPRSAGRLAVEVLELDSGTIETVGMFDAAQFGQSVQGYLLRLPFEPKPSFAAGGGVLWLGRTDSRTVVRWHKGVRSTLALPLGRSPVTRQDRERWKRFDAEHTPAVARGALREHHRSLQFPDSTPAYQELHADREGNLWVMRYSRPWSTEPYAFDVFDAGGSRLGSVEMEFEALGSRPRSALAPGISSPLLDIGSQHILVLHTDDLGVETIVGYRLSRPVRR